MAVAEEFGSLFEEGTKTTWWAHFYNALCYHLKHVDGDATNQSYKAFWRSENSFLFFERKGERVTTRLGPEYLVAVPMDLLNGPTQHGVWGSTHEGLQIRVKTVTTNNAGRLEILGFGFGGYTSHVLSPTSYG